jgi:hypothetical protein
MLGWRMDMKKKKKKKKRRLLAPPSTPAPAAHRWQRQHRAL